MEEQEGSGYVLEEDEINFVKKLQLGTGRFRGKLPFKCFSCGRFVHYTAKCPHKDKYEKGKELDKRNKKLLSIEKIIILMNIVMAYQIVKKENLIKILDFSWLLKRTLVSLKINLWML